VGTAEREIVEQYPLVRAGTLTRWPQWWTIQQYKVYKSDQNHFVAFLNNEAGSKAFVRYHAQQDGNWLYSRDPTLVVDDLHAPDLDSYQALTNFLLQMDITWHVVLPNRPIDDPLRLMVDNPRAVSVTAQRDETWLRIIDVETVLNARTYNQNDPIILEIIDPLFPQNQGCRQISTHGAERSSRVPDASISIDGLAGLLTGSAYAWQLHASDALRLRSPGILPRLEKLFAVSEQPWSGIIL